MTLRPGMPDSGIMFSRRGVPYLIRDARIPITGDKWTTLQWPDWCVHSPEHVLSAILGMGIDNIVIELDDDGIPLLDGSARSFAWAIHEAGVVEQQPTRRYIEVPWPVMVKERRTDFRTGELRTDYSYLLAWPSEEFRIIYTLDYEGTPLSTQFVDIRITPESYLESIASARTFMTSWEIERWEGTRLSLHFCNSVPGVDNQSVFIERCPHEAAYHKVLDLIGDLGVMGTPIRGLFLGLRSGHSLNNEMVRGLWKKP